MKILYHYSNTFNLRRMRLGSLLFALTGFLLVFQFIAPVLTDASPTITEYPITSGYGNPNSITTAPGTDGSMWYAEYDSSSGYTDEIGNITTSGTITDYSAIPSGDTWATVAYMTTGPDGNVWFSGCAGTASTGEMILGILNVSTGSISATPHDTGVGCGGPYEPGPIAVDSNGNVWIAVNAEVTGHSWVDRFTSSGVYSYYWEVPYGTLPTWNSMTAGPSNTLWLTDSIDNQVDALTLSSSTYDVTAENEYNIPTAYSSPGNITLGSDGNLWFTEQVTDKIGTITPSGTFTEYTIPSGNEPNEIAAGPDGALWFTEPNNGGIGRITTAGSITEYSTPSGSEPESITAGPDNAMWYTDDQRSAEIGRISTEPFATEYPITSGYGNPNSITTAPGTDGSMWYAEYDSSSGYTDEIGNITTSGTITDYSAIPSGDTWATVAYMTTGPDGNVWFSGCAGTASTGEMILGILNVSTGSISATPHDTGVGCGGPYEPGPIAVDSNGNVWIAVNAEVTGHSWVDRFTSSGVYSYYWEVPYGTLPTWNSMTAGPSNTLWLTDSIDNQVDALTLSSSTYDVTAENEYNIPTAYSSPGNITLGSDGNLWFTEQVTDKIGTITPSGTFTEYTIPSGNEPNEIAAGPDGALWFTEPNNGGIGRITTAGSITEYSTPSGSEPESITAGPDNAMWYTDDQRSAEIGRIGY